MREKEAVLECERVMEPERRRTAERREKDANVVRLTKASWETVITEYPDICRCVFLLHIGASIPVSVSYLF